MAKYIVGFNRDRDSYQVPAALAERDALAVLVTDYYRGRSLFRIRRLSHRFSSVIAPALVKTVAGALWPQLVFEACRRIGRPIPFPSHMIDASIARALAREARRRPSDALLIYSNYAWLAFKASTSHERVLFQYHPSNLIIREAMALDELGQVRQWQQESEEIDPKRAEIERIELASATRFLCASNFTARGLILSGIPPELIEVVPYGCPTPPLEVQTRRERVLLFVGQGVQRKGLHILLEAWRRLRPTGWTLRVVASRLDPAMQEFLDGAEGVVATGAVSRDQLVELYDTSSALILPSLVEGFGLVLGEALAHGCSLIASENTGLPDFGLAEPVAHVVEPGSVDDLVRAMSAHIELHETGQVNPQLNSNCAAERSWDNFREGIREALEGGAPETT